MAARLSPVTIPDFQPSSGGFSPLSIESSPADSRTSSQEDSDSSSSSPRSDMERAARVFNRYSPYQPRESHRHDSFSLSNRASPWQLSSSAYGSPASSPEYYSDAPIWPTSLGSWTSTPGITSFGRASPFPSSESGCFPSTPPSPEMAPGRSDLPPEFENFLLPSAAALDSIPEERTPPKENERSDLPVEPNPFLLLLPSAAASQIQEAPLKRDIVTPPDLKHQIDSLRVDEYLYPDRAPAEERLENLFEIWLKHHTSMAPRDVVTVLKSVDVLSDGLGIREAQTKKPRLESERKG